MNHPPAQGYSSRPGGDAKEKCHLGEREASPTGIGVFYVLFFLSFCSEYKDCIPPCGSSPEPLAD